MIIMTIELFGLENIPIIDGDSDISQIIKEAIEKLRSSLNAKADTDTLKADIEALEKAFYAISEKLYAQNGGAQGFDPNAAGAQGDTNDGTYYNADYEDKTN